MLVPPFAKRGSPRYFICLHVPSCICCHTMLTTRNNTKHKWNIMGMLLLSGMCAHLHTQLLKLSFMWVGTWVTMHSKCVLSVMKNWILLKQLKANRKRKIYSKNFIYDLLWKNTKPCYNLNAIWIIYLMKRLLYTKYMS